MLRELETRGVRAWAARVPRGIETYHLTLLTLVWTAGALGIAWLAQGDRRWLWGLSAMVVLQYVTDVLDGAVGRLRGTGLVKWGYYMDHFVDFLFMGAVLFCWTAILPGPSRMLAFLAFVLCGAFTTNAHLTFAVTNEFHISHFNLGATEMRLGFLLANGLAAHWGADFLRLLLPVVVSVQLIALSVIVYRTQRTIWSLDMRAKAAAGEGEAARRARVPGRAVPRAAVAFAAPGH